MSVPLRIGAVLADRHAVDDDPLRALDLDRQLVEAARDHLDAVVLHQGWATGPTWTLQALTTAAHLAGAAGPLHVSVRGLPLGVMNPVEVAEQIATVDHARDGRLDVTVSVGSAAALPAFAVDDETARARFAEGLHVLRHMWSLDPFAWEGTQFQFGQVRPTLGCAQAGGPPLSLAVSEPEGARTAAAHGLGCHLLAGVRAELGDRVLEAYGAAGGTGPRSVALSFEDATAERMSALAAAGVAAVDVRLTDRTEDPSIAPARVAALADRVAELR